MNQINRNSTRYVLLCLVPTSFIAWIISLAFCLLIISLSMYDVDFRSTSSLIFKVKVSFDRFHIFLFRSFFRRSYKTSINSNNDNKFINLFPLISLTTYILSLSLLKSAFNLLCFMLYIVARQSFLQVHFGIKTLNLRSFGLGGLWAFFK